MAKHIADAEAAFMVVNVTPDFCEVNGTVVPFDIYQRLPPEKSAYSGDVLARSKKTLTVGSVVEGTIGNMGAGVLSGSAQGTGHTLLTEGDPTVLIDGKATVRHGHRCMMNVKI